MVEFDNFVEKSKIVHNNKYDYSMVKYVNSRTKVKIVCNIHGEFDQVPASHIRGNGCYECFNDKRKNKNIIEDLKLKHGDRYDYSLVDYINNTTSIKIKCNMCLNIFEQSPKSHKNGHGCPFCAGRHQTNLDIIDKFIKIHGEKYNYALVNYVNSKTKVKIVCNHHGVFEQLSCNHIIGNECPKCHGINMTTDDFITRSNEIHNNKYEYDLTAYIKSIEKVIITCKKHGNFKQRPNDHLNGNGCPKCSYSLGELEIEKYLIDNNIEYDSQHKFENCKNINRLPFDFYLPYYNICIEYDGEQHFKPSLYFGGIESFEKLKINDEIKNNFCKNYNLTLLRIKYNDFENINFILNTKIK